MDKQSKAILEFAVSQPGCEELLFSINEEWDDDANISLGDLADGAGLAPADTRSTVRYLVENDYAEYICLNLSSGPLPVAFKLKHKGIHWKEFRQIAFCDYFKEKWIDILALAIACAALLKSYESEISLLLDLLNHS